jgi:hypothetical protein
MAVIDAKARARRWPISTNPKAMENNPSAINMAGRFLYISIF